MIERDFLRLVRLGAIELELQHLEQSSRSAPPLVGAEPSRAPAIEPSPMEIARRVALLASIGERVLQKHDLRHHEPEVAR